MNRTRRLNILSIITNVIILTSSILGIVYGCLEYGIVENIRRFSVILNFFTILGSFFLIVRNSMSIYDNKDTTGKGIYFYMLICGVNLTNAAVFNFMNMIINPDYAFKYTLSTTFCSIITPVFMLVLVITTIIKYEFDLRDSLYCTIPSLLYGASYFFVILSSGKSLDYYGIYQEGQLLPFILSVVCFVVFSFLIALIVILVHNHITNFGTNSKLVLRNGIMIPRVGIELRNVNDEDMKVYIKNALNVGYTHFDLSADKDNINIVGSALKECNVDRKKIFLSYQLSSNIRSPEDLLKNVEEATNKLETTYLDLLLLPSPNLIGEKMDDQEVYNRIKNLWKKMEEIYNKGIVKSIGLYDFNAHDIKMLIQHIHVPPMVNQIHMTICDTPVYLVKYCKKCKILIEASPSVRENTVSLNDPIVNDIAIKYRISPRRLGVRYLLDLHCVCLIDYKTKNELEECFDTDIRINKSDEFLLSNLEKNIIDSNNICHYTNTRDYYEID